MVAARIILKGQNYWLKSDHVNIYVMHTQTCQCGCTSPWPKRKLKKQYANLFSWHIVAKELYYDWFNLSSDNTIPRAEYSDQILKFNYLTIIGHYWIINRWSKDCVFSLTALIFLLWIFVFVYGDGGSSPRPSERERSSTPQYERSPTSQFQIRTGKNRKGWEASFTVHWAWLCYAWNHLLWYNSWS